jgi:hypothetical protein
MQLGKTQTLQISEKINSGWILIDEESGEKLFFLKFSFGRTGSRRIC